MNEFKSAKDKECPFCHQAFTCSSLGRHLDLYIKEKNPKPPDDLHHVEEIRRIRGLITRRQPRQSLRHQTSTPSSSKATPLHEQASPIPSSHNTDNGAQDVEPFRTFVNHANWQATGVINEVDTTPRTKHGGWETRRTASSKGQVKEGINRKREYLDAMDEARAAELALKEVLESVRAANQHAHPPRPFDFNFFNLSLPQMYLRCLTPPPALLVRPADRPHELAWSVDVPSAEQCEILRGWLAAKLTDWRRRRDSAQYGVSWLRNGSQGNEDAQAEVEAIRQEGSAYYGHLEKSFEAWTKFTEMERQDQWRVECAKAFAAEKERHQETQRRLDETEQEVRQLRARLDQMASDLHGADTARYPATPLPLSREAVSYLPAFSELDHAKIVSKWRTRIQSARNTQQPLPGSSWNSSLPKLDTNGNHQADREHCDSWASNTEAHSGSGLIEAEDTDFEDAPGEEDLDHLQQQGQPIGSEHTLFDHDLRSEATLNNVKQNGIGQTPMDLG